MLNHPWNSPPLRGFIVFEGLDGAGTTTQAHRLVRALNEAGRPAEFTCEPTDFLTGTTIRRLLNGPEHVEPWTLALLFAADRNEHLNRPVTGVRARLSSGVTVVSDRYLFSSLAYQGALADAAAVETLNAAFPLPEHVVFIDTPRSEAMRRMDRRGGRDVLEQDDVQRRAADRYRRIIEEFGRRTQIRLHHIDGSGSLDLVTEEMLRSLEVSVPSSWE